MSQEYVSTPYWWDEVDAPPSSTTALPDEADVVIVGAGYTGLAAGWELARHGRRVVVVDRDDIGRGASGRNGGMVHPGGKHDLATMLAMPRGRAMWDDTVAAFEGVEALVTELGLACDWRRSGHLELAGHPRHVGHLRSVAESYASIGEEARFLGPEDLGREIGSRAFAGGLLVARSGSVQPAKLVHGVAAAALSAGAELHGRTEASAVERDATGFSVVTSRGTIRAGEVVVATDGTTQRRPVPWLWRRILGIGSFMIASEPIDEALARSVSPAGRMFFDTKNFLNYWRLSPDGRRVLFGGRTSFAPTTVEQARDRLYGAMVRVHPQLAGVRVAHAWGGLVGLTLDRLPHVGRHPETGIVYAAGYCGTGVALSTHFGRAIGLWLCGEGELPPFAGRRWPVVPPPAHVPWLLPIAGWWYQGRDALGL
ncbi:MAG TPA: FAD-binding oxidoreductase [Acidimicrobiales bacterium]|nr:FAD-binding oxidoreductase [Acidimicrobiales bacterium]